MNLRTLPAILLGAIALASCNSGARVSAPTSLPPTATLLPAATATLTSVPTVEPPAATHTPVPTHTAIPTQTPASAKPTFTLTAVPTATIPRPTSSVTGTQTVGTPVAGWKGFPIMPGAIEGREAGFSYLYAVRVPISEAEAYYQKQMIAGGWTLDKRQSSETSMFGGPAVTLSFARNGKQAFVMLVFSAKENYTMVMLTPGS